MDSRFVEPNDLESRWWYVKSDEETYEDKSRGWMADADDIFAMLLVYVLPCVFLPAILLFGGLYLPALIVFLSGTALAALLVCLRYVYVKRMTGFTRQYVRKDYPRISQRLSYEGRGYLYREITAVKETKKMAKTIVTKTEYRMIDPSLPEKTFMEVLNNGR